MEATQKMVSKPIRVKEARPVYSWAQTWPCCFHPVPAHVASTSQGHCQSDITKQKVSCCSNVRFGASMLWISNHLCFFSRQPQEQAPDLFSGRMATYSWLFGEWANKHGGHLGTLSSEVSGLLEIKVGCVCRLLLPMLLKQLYCGVTAIQSSTGRLMQQITIAGTNLHNDSPVPILIV